ncbi:acyltransferase family protein [Leifsonia sp. Le1]|uniref:acyltransferase family protein n=1 Tax=Leifsonia sp. Le1 TaxID=3404918 RepID=UPI003EBF7B7C
MPAPVPAPHRSFRRDVQGLRALAVVAVILDHLLHWPRGGFVGVDVFFVISGFLITGLLLREIERDGRISFSAFYRNRIRRILPAAALVLVVTVSVGWGVYGTERALSIVRDAGWSALFAANWNFASAGTDYFRADGPPSPLQHFWSLAVEEQFYVVWPLVMLVILAVVSRRTVDERRVRTGMGVALLLIITVSFAWAAFESAASPSWAYFSTFSRAWELGIGGLLALSAAMLERLPRWSAPVLLVAGLCGIVGSIAFIDDGMPFPGPWAAVPVVATAAVIASGARVELRTAWPLTNPVSQYIGNISYSLYLWHFPVVVIGVSLIGEGAWQYALLALIVAAASVYSFHLVEAPVRRSGWLARGWTLRRSGSRGVTTSSRSRTVLVLSFLACIAVATTAFAGAKNAQTVKPVVAAPAWNSASDDAPPTEEAHLAALQDELRAALVEPGWPELDPTIDVALQGGALGFAAADIVDCNLAPVVDESKCTWGAPTATKTVLVAGSSIATGITSMLIDALRDEPDWKVVSYARIACSFGDVSQAKEKPEGCLERADAVVEAVNRIQPELVAIAGFSDTGVKEKLAEIAAPSKIALIAMSVSDKPLASCYTKLSGPQDCVSAAEKLGPKSFFHRLAAIDPARRFVIDTTDWFCADGLCPPFAGKTITKSDGIHMTEAYTKRLAPVMHERLAKAGLFSS